MSTITVTLPDQLKRSVEELAVQRKVSMDQFISDSLSEIVSASQQIEYLKQRAARGSREEFLKVLAKVPDVEPDEEDRMD